MKKSAISYEHEKVIARAIAPIARELRLVDIADLIAMIRYERRGNLSDLVTSAAELYFLPETIRLGIGGDYVVDWDNEPKILLDVEVMLESTRIYVRLTLEKDRCGFEVDHVEYSDGLALKDQTAEQLETQFEAAAFSFQQLNEIQDLRRSA